MQNAKDTFYTMLKGRLATINPSRTILVRGTVRPGLLVEENELPNASPPPDCFRLHWTNLQVLSTSPLPLMAMECSFAYTTAGNVGNVAMDRGRMLATMDAELNAALTAAPRSAPKMDYAATGVGIAPTAMGTNIFWADPVFNPVIANDEQLERTATVQVYAYREAGEL